jgi:isopentenyl diphosphate isomerase/L-lactate dehydrogenase-like FMN-dependent dehydrogenase
MLIERASNAGCKALVITVDSQAQGGRERSYRERAFAPSSLAMSELVRLVPQVATKPRWLLDFIARSRGERGLTVPMARSGGAPLPIFEMQDELYRETPTWEDIPWLRERWHGKLVIKGILTPSDARRAASEGADAIVVSNHGGNGLDGRPATLRMLRPVVDAVANDVEVWMDGGVRRGSDIVKALALGATAVLIGRAYVYGLMAGGEAGVSRIIDILRSGVDETLALLGCPSVRDLDRSYVELPDAWR